MIIALKEDNRVVLGMSCYDTLAQMSPKDLALAENQPVWKLKTVKNCYVGIKDNHYAGEILRCNEQIFKGLTDAKSVAEVIIPRIKKLLKDNHCLICGSDMPIEITIIKDNNIYFIDKFFVFNEKDEWVNGYHKDTLLGGIEGSKDIKSATERILSIMRVVSNLELFNGFPITIIDTKTHRRKVYYK